jgi:hypothetical protein
MRRNPPTSVGYWLQPQTPGRSWRPPSVRASLDLATDMDTKRLASLTVAMNCLNALPAVLKPPPGIENYFSIAGRGVALPRPMAQG